MSSLKFFLPGLICIAFSCKTTPGTNKSTLTKEEVLAFVKTYDDAWNTRKRDVVDSLYASHYRYFTSVGDVSSRRRNLEILSADYYQLTSAIRSEIEITIEENTAIVSSRWRGSGTWRGTPFEDNQRCGLVIQKRGTELKLLSEHCVEIINEAPE